MFEILIPPDILEKLLNALFHDKYDEAHEIFQEHFPNIKKENLYKIKDYGYQIPFVSLWNSWIDNDLDEYNEGYFIRKLSYPLLSKVNIMTIKNSKTIEELRDFFYYNSYFAKDPEECLLTGKTFSFEIIENKIKLLEWTSEGRRREVIPNDFYNDVFEVDVTFETGELYIADWFRTENNEFSNYVTKEDKYDINSLKPIIEQVYRYANKFKLLSVPVGNSLPSIYNLKNTIAIGKDKGDFKEEGYVCTDLWNASVIDKKNFKSILKESGMSKSQVVEEISKIENDINVIKLKVPKGRYRLYFSGQYNEFDEIYRKKYKNRLRKTLKLYFLIKKIK